MERMQEVCNNVAPNKEPLMISLGIAAAVAIATSSATPAVIEAQRPVRVRVTARTRIADGGAIGAALIDPIYSRDRIIVAAGAAITGHLETVHGVASRDHAAAVSGGDFTPATGARARFEAMTPVGEAPITIAASATIDIDEPASRRGEWLKDYVLTQLPFHPRYVHADSVLTMTFVEPVMIVRMSAPSPIPTSAVPARLLTPIDSATATVGDQVTASLLAPVHTPDGAITPQGTVIVGHVSAVSRARAFGRGGRIEIRIDDLSTAIMRRDPPVRFIWPPLATLALVGARDPSAPDQSTFFGRAGAGWSGFLAIGAAVAQVSEPVALGLGAWGLAHSTWINVLRRGRNVVLPSNSIVLLSVRPSS